MYVSTQEKEEKRFKQNPNPQKQYRMTITIENAPGEFEKLDSFAHYRALNCSYKLEGPAGAVTQPDTHIPLEFKKISDNQYQGDFYVDAMLNENYYGENLCEWELMNTTVLFSATHNKEDTNFSVSISDQDLSSHKLEFNHLKKNYPGNQNMAKYLSQGGLKKERFNAEDYFTFYVELEEI